MELHRIEHEKLSLSPCFKSKQEANVYKARGESQMKGRIEDIESKKILSLLTPGKKGPCLCVPHIPHYSNLHKGYLFELAFFPSSLSFEECFPSVICLSLFQDSFLKFNSFFLFFVLEI